MIKLVQNFISVKLSKGIGIMKYMRIQGREESYITKYPKGIFSLCWNLIRDDILTSEEKKLFISIDGNIYYR